MSRSRPIDRPATYADIEALPPHVVGEILDGELVVAPRPRSTHARAGSSLGAILGGPFDLGSGGPGGWIILFEPELHLGQHVLVPDFAGWRRTRMPEMPDAAYFTLAPDWVCEILSPSSQRYDRGRKLDVYAAEGVEYVWLIDPDAQSLEAFVLREGLWARLGAWAGEETPRAQPFDAIELPMRYLWMR